MTVVRRALGYFEIERRLTDVQDRPSDLVCTENSIRVDEVQESPNLAG